jgi:hypothetical protein
MMNHPKTLQILFACDFLQKTQNRSGLAYSEAVYKLDIGYTKGPNLSISMSEII